MSMQFIANYFWEINLLSLIKEFLYSLIILMKSYIHKKDLSTTVPFDPPYWDPQRPGPFVINTVVTVHVLLMG